MKLMFLPVILVFIFASGVFGADSTATGPKITFAESEFDFGEIEVGEVAEHVFTFENTGTDTLRISQVYSG